MAKVRKNVLLEGLSGMVADQLVFRQDKAGRTIVSIRPHFDENREFTEDQLEQQGRFQEAAAYAKDASKTEPVYSEKAEGTAKSAYNVAVADWFHTPEVGDIDLNNYTGETGEVIRAKVVDDVQVAQVNILIATGAEVLVEQGEMTHDQGLWYTYTTTANCPAGEAEILVTGFDLPGHEGASGATLTVE